MKKKISYSFLTIGKTQESSEGNGNEFKRYIGVGSSKVLAVNPNKKELDELMGYESANEPEYVVDNTELGCREVRITFIVRTDPAQGENKAKNIPGTGVEITNRLTFILRNAPDYSKDGSTVRVIDKYGNTARVPTEDARAGKTLPSNLKIDQNNYRMAAVGEADLVAFLKTFLNIPSSLDYINGAWSLSEKADDGKFGLDEIKEYFKGDFKEIRKAISYQPNNKIKLLYGVKTTDEGKQYQAVCTKAEFFLRNGIQDYSKLQRDLQRAKDAGFAPTTEYEACNIKEYTVTPTNLEEAPAADGTDDDMPW